LRESPNDITKSNHRHKTRVIRTLALVKPSAGECQVVFISISLSEYDLLVAANTKKP
jgi:hypothetical protein